MTNEYRRSNHTTFLLQIHIAWITKYRYKVIKGEIAEHAKKYLRRICSENNVEILSGAISQDHIHMLISIDPSISVSKLVKYLKGKSSRHLQMQFPELKKRYWGPTSMGTRLLRRLDRQCHDRNDQG